MNVLYLTNKLVKDKKVIPEIIKSCGDNVHCYDGRIDLNILDKRNIDL